MKKLTITIVMAMLCLHFRAAGQESSSIRPLKVGDRIPQLTLSALVNHRTVPIRLADYNGKLLIIDFWATWCAPCVTMIPKIDSLQQRFAGKVQFLSVSTQSRETIETFLTRIEQQQHLQLRVPNITADQQLSKLFPYNYLPHYVWIDQSGKVSNFTSFDQINAETIADFLSGKRPTDKLSNEAPPVAYDKTKPLFYEQNGGTNNEIIAHSYLGKYAPGLELGYTLKGDSVNGVKLTARNQCIAQLFEIAYGNAWQFAGEKNVVFNVRDKTKVISELVGTDFINWLADGNAYCYELILPGQQIAMTYKKMRDDLALFFPHYTAVKEKRKTLCMVLRRTSPVDKIKSKGGDPVVDMEPIHAQIKNAYLNQFAMRLDMMNSGTPVINDTGYKGRVDLELNAALSDFNALNKELARYDLAFYKEEREMEFLIISDAAPSAQHKADTAKEKGAQQ